MKMEFVVLKSELKQKNIPFYEFNEKNELIKTGFVMRNAPFGTWNLDDIDYQDLIEDGGSAMTKNCITEHATLRVLNDEDDD